MLDTVHFAFVTHTVYDYAVTNFMNIAPLFVVNWCEFRRFLPAAARSSHWAVSHFQELGG